MDSRRTETIAVKVRPEMKAWLASAAAREFRSLSAEICRLLEAEFSRSKVAGSTASSGAIEHA